MVFRQFIGVFARPEHPPALFLDNSQWLARRRSICWKTAAA
jgi:hypothetical protein